MRLSSSTQLNSKSIKCDDNNTGWCWWYSFAFHNLNIHSNMCIIILLTFVFMNIKIQKNKKKLSIKYPGRMKRRGRRYEKGKNSKRIQIRYACNIIHDTIRYDDDDDDVTTEQYARKTDGGYARRWIQFCSGRVEAFFCTYTPAEECDAARREIDLKAFYIFLQLSAFLVCETRAITKHPQQSVSVRQVSKQQTVRGEAAVAGRVTWQRWQEKHKFRGA